MRLMGMRLRFRSLGLALLSVAAAGVLLQAWSGAGVVQEGEGEGVDGVCGEGARARRLREAAARVRRTPARPMPASGTPPRAPASRSSSRAERRCSLSSVRASSEEGAAGLALVPRREPRCRHPGRAPNAGQRQLPDRKRSRQVRTGVRRMSASLPRPLAGRGHGLRGPERQVEVRVPRSPEPASATSGLPTAARSGSRSTAGNLLFGPRSAS